MPKFPIFLVGVVIASLAVAAAADPAPTTAPAPRPPLDASTPITLEVRDEPIESVLDKLTQISGMKVIYKADPPAATTRRITLLAQQEHFWEVIDDICDQCNGDCSIAGDGGQVEIHTLSAGVRPPACVAGPLRFTSGQIEHLDDLTAADPDYCTVWLTADIEPRVRPLFYVNAVAAGAAEDENGLSLAPPAGASLNDPRQPPNPLNPDHFAVMPDQHARNIGFAVRIAVPPTAGRHIAVLQGTLQLWVADGDETFEFDHPDTTGKTPSPATLPSGMNIALRQEGTDTLSLGVLHQGRSDPQWKLDELRVQVAQLWIIDSAGNRSSIAPNGGASWGSTEHWCNFSPPQQTGKIVAQIPIPREIDIPFDFRNLPLP